MVRRQSYRKELFGLISLTDDVVSATISVPFLDWNFKLKRPTVSYVDPTHIVVPGLAGMPLVYLSKLFVLTLD